MQREHGATDMWLWLEIFDKLPAFGYGVAAGATCTILMLLLIVIAFVRK